MSNLIELTEQKLEKLNFKYSHTTDNHRLWYINEKYSMALDYEKNIINIFNRHDGLLEYTNYFNAGSIENLEKLELFKNV